MPTFSIESPQTGQTYQVQFDREPSPEDLDFAAKQFDSEWWQQQGIEPGSEITQQTPLETVGNAIVNVGPTLAGMVGGGMRYLDKAAEVVADVTGTQRGGLFEDIAKQAEGIQAEGDVLRPLSPANPTAQFIGQGAAQGIGMLGTAAASVPALGARGMMAVPAVLGFGAGGGEGVQQGEAMGLSPMGQLAQGTAFGAAEAATEMLGGIGGRFLPPAGSLIGRMAGGVASETIEEPAAGALQEAITNVAGMTVADPQRPGFTTTGFQLPGTAGYLERRGQEAIGGAAGGLVFAGVQPLMRAPGVGQPLSEAPAVAPDAVPESTGDLTAEDVADLEPQPMPQREPILTGVPDRMARVRENALNTEPVMEGDVITDLRVPRSPEAIAESQRIENDRLAQEAKLRAQEAKARGMPMVADSPTGSRDIVDWANENPIYLPPGFSADRKLPEYDALQRNPLPPYWRQFVASSKQGGNPDSIAQRAFDAGLIAEPTPDAYLQALQEGIAGRQQYRVQFAQRDKALAQEEKRVIDFEKSQTKLAKNKDTQQVPFEDIVPGDQMTIDGEPAVVRNVEYNEDGYLTNVVIEDGKRFGLMQFDPQTRGGLLVDEFKPASQPFAPAATQDQPQTITGSNEQTGSEMPVPPPTAAAGAGAGGVVEYDPSEFTASGDEIPFPNLQRQFQAAAGEVTMKDVQNMAAARRAGLPAREALQSALIEKRAHEAAFEAASRVESGPLAQQEYDRVYQMVKTEGAISTSTTATPPATAARRAPAASVGGAVAARSKSSGRGTGASGQAVEMMTPVEWVDATQSPGFQRLFREGGQINQEAILAPYRDAIHAAMLKGKPVSQEAMKHVTGYGFPKGKIEKAATKYRWSDHGDYRPVASASTEGFKNLDTSGRTAGFLNTEILSEARQLIADGFTTFANWSQAMVTRFGRGIREFLQGIWQQITSPQTNAAQNVRLGMPQGNAPVSIGAGGFVGGGQASNIPEGQDVTRSRFASPDEGVNLYDIQATETMRAESAAWLEANGIEAALAAMEANSPPQGLRIDHLPSLGAQVITRLAKLAESGTEAQRIQADVLLERASRAWHGKMSQQAGTTLQQRAMATDELRGIASILTTKELLVERADRVVKERFEGGAKGAVQQVKDIDTKASTQAGEELAAQLDGEPDAPELGDNPEVSPVNDNRVAELEKQMQDLREQMVREQTQAESTLAQTTSTWQKIMGVLQAAGGRKSSLLTGAKGKLAAMRKAALARKAARRAEGRLSANPVEDFADDAIIGAAILAEGLVEFTNWSQAIMREVGFRSGQDLRRLYAEASKKYLEALEAEKAAPTKAKGTPKQRQAREKINKAQRTAQNILDSLARRYSDPPLFDEGQRRVNAMRELYKERVKTGMPEAEFVKRAMALGANEGTAGILWEASKLEIDAREMMALEKSRAGLAGYLKKDSPALAKLLDALRKKVAPGMTWAEIFMTLPAEQKARQREIYRRLMLDNRLKALNQGERLQLTNELDRAWQRERRKVFVRELEKITGLGKTKKDRDKVKAALPRLLRLMNLGLLNSETFRGAIAQEYGIQQIDAATGAELRKLGEQIQQAPEGLPRRKLEQQLMQRLQNLTGSTMAEVLESWWTASVLSGWRTQMDIALSLANGLEDVALGSLVIALRTGNGRVAKDALFGMLSNLPTAMNEALDHLLTGNRAAMRSYDAEVKAALEDGNKLFGNVGRQLLNKGGMAKLPGAFMEFVSRMMTALDHINSTSTYEGAKAMALARHPELYEKALTISPQDRQAARTQARLELTGGEAPTTRQQRVEEDARVKEILDQRVPLEFQAQAREIGLESALQGEPTGLGHWVYKAANNLNQTMRQAETAYDQNRPDNAAGKAVMAALRLSSTLVKVLTGTKFVRTVGHSVNRSLSYAPGIGLVRFAEGGMKGAKADILLAKQLMGTAVGLALLMAFRDGEDDEQGIAGSWRELTPQQKGQLLAEGKQPYSIWKRDEQGRIRSWNYQQWGIAGVLATIGAMEDQRRYNSQGKDDLAILMDGIVSGSMAWTDKTQLTGLQMLMAKDQAATSSPSSSLAGALNKWASTTVGGLVPRLFKDVDMVISPQLRDTSEWWMKWAGQMPMVREMSSGKRVNIFGEDIVLDRGPTSRITQVGTLDPALRTLGRLNERDIWLPDPTQGVRMVKLADGTRRKMTPAEKDRYQRATGAAYRQFITEQGANLLRMDPELARETISNVTEQLRNQAAYQAVRR